MQLTLHVTKACNLKCSYCYYRDFPSGLMSPETARLAVAQVLNLGAKHLGITFFGGEPLLAKNLIREIVPEIQEMCRRLGTSVNFKIPTNGLLLDEDFITFCEKHAVFLSLSIDGVETANMGRLTLSGKNSYPASVQALSLLVRHSSTFATYSVVTPHNAGTLSRSLQFLYQRGSRILISALDYAADWTREDLAVLEKQYRELAEFFIIETRRKHHFYLSIFDSRIRAHTRPDQSQDTSCRIGVGQLSVLPNGSYYPCIQFVEDPRFAIGHVNSGIDLAKRDALFANGHLGSPECASCGLNERCSRNCACVSWQTTGTLDTIAPIVCEHERLLTPIADWVGKKLFRRRDPLFLNKHYNPAYDMLRTVEDVVVQNRNNHEALADSRR